jgi:hypothetical protein
MVALGLRARSPLTCCTPCRGRVIQGGPGIQLSSKWIMRCTSCGSESPDSKRFCGDCGSPLSNRCARCGVENPAGKKFCRDCGADLSQPRPLHGHPSPRPHPSWSKHGEPHEPSDGERRQLTGRTEGNSTAGLTGGIAMSELAELRGRPVFRIARHRHWRFHPNPLCRLRPSSASSQPSARSAATVSSRSPTPWITLAR